MSYLLDHQNEMNFLHNYKRSEGAKLESMQEEIAKFNDINYDHQHKKLKLIFKILTIKFNHLNIINNEIIRTININITQKQLDEYREGYETMATMANAFQHKVIKFDLLLGTFKNVLFDINNLKGTAAKEINKTFNARHLKSEMSF